MNATKLFAAAALALSCSSDPRHDGAVGSLGKEFKNVPVGELHRAGQPCLVCHGGTGPANQVFSVAGTIFAGPSVPVGVDQADVEMVDANQTKFVAHTNCVGNFFVKPDEWSPAFPILVRVAKSGVSLQMRSPINREGSCAHCHVLAITPNNADTNMPWVYLFGQPEPNGPPTCAVNPDLSQP
jgi:hypothetical protein